MEDKKVLEVVDVYEKHFQAQRIPKVKHDHNRFCDGPIIGLAHCYSMLNGIKEFISLGGQEKRDRALKRLGFIEGCLWIIRHYTVEQLKEFNRPDRGTLDTQTHEPLTHEDLQDWEY